MVQIHDDRSDSSPCQPFLESLRFHRLNVDTD